LLAILIPVGAMLIVIAVEPPPYRLIAMPDRAWLDGRTLPSGARVIATVHGDADAAYGQARRQFDSTATASSVRSPGIYRYRAADDGRYGMIVPVGRLVVQITAPRQDAIDEAVHEIPFIADETQGSLSSFMANHVLVFAAGIIVYTLLLVVLLFRGLAWGAQRAPTKGRPAVDQATLRARLLDLHGNGLAVDARGDRDIIVSPVASEGRIRLRVRFDPEDRVVRGILGGSDRRVEGLSVTASWWRTIPMKGGWCGRVADTVLDSGWTWRPVLTFLRPIGG
jgi:hypothetical protein